MTDSSLPRGPIRPPNVDPDTGEVLAAPDVLEDADGDKLSPDAFVDWIRDHPANVLGHELSGHLRDCIEATRIHGKKSTLRLDVEITNTSSRFGELLVTPKVTSKPAQADIEARPYFPTANGGLSRRNPDQPSIPFPKD